MFQKYLRNSTEKVIHAINIGTMELANLRQTVFTPEFILLGILEQDESIVQRIIEDIVNEPVKIIDAISERIYALQPKNDEPTDVVNITLSPEVERVFELAMDESKKLNDKYNKSLIKLKHVKCRKAIGLAKKRMEYLKKIYSTWLNKE